MIAFDTAEKAKKYSDLKARIFFAGHVINALAILLFLFFLSEPVSRMAARASGSFYVSCLVFVSIFFLFVYFTGLPLGIYSSFIVEHRFGLSRQNARAYIEDEVKGAGISIFLEILLVEAFYLVLFNFPGTWWLVSSLGWLFLSVLIAELVPFFVIPIFYKYSPIENVSLATRIQALAEKAGIKLLGVCQIDFSRKTSKANAALVGLGAARRVILTDTLLHGFTDGEAEVVVAHEFGHFKHKHIWKLLFVSCGVTLAGFFILFILQDKLVSFTGIAGITNIRLFPIFVLLVSFFDFILLPVNNIFSRCMEREADKFALDLTKRPDDFISVMDKLARMNFADRSPGMLKKIFMYNHPPVSERIQLAKKYSCANQESL